jgi:gamma-glutamyltranspeptidase/glutathione hydrolase
MLSSMTPTILAKDGNLVAVVGSPGGRTIINSVLEVVLNIVDFGMGIDEAVSAKRFHHQWLPDGIRIEADGVTEAAFAGLESMGHTVSMAGSQGRTHCIMLDPVSGKLIGAPDPRDGDGGAAGY